MPDDNRPVTVDLPIRLRDAQISAATANKEARSVEVIWSTGQRARAYVPQLGFIQEELDMSPAAVRMERLASGRAPLLDKHSGWSVRDVLGRVAEAALADGVGTGRVEFSRRAEVEPIWQDVQDKILSQISVGYRVYRYAPIDLTAEPPIYRAVDWEPFELSLCPVAVDTGAGVRSADLPTNPCEISQRAVAAHNQESEMNTQNNATAAQPTVVDQARATPAAPAGGAPAAGAVVAAPDLDAIRREAAEAERRRAAGIRERVRSVAGQLGDGADALADDLVTRGVSLDHVGNEIVNAIAARGLPATRPSGSGAQVGVDNTDPALIGRSMALALAVRATSHLTPQQGRVALPEGDRAREFMQHSALDLFADLARAHGVNIPRFMGRAQLWDFLVQQRSLATSDFPILLADASNKILGAGYMLANNTYRLVAARKTFTDFKPHNFIRAGDFPQLLQVGETGEYKFGVMGEAKQAVLLASYGRIIRISRRIIINDDLGAFSDLPLKAGRRVADFENALGWAQINGGNGPTITETGRALFNTTDKTLAAANAVISVASVGIGRASMMNQTSIDGLKLNVAPKFLVTSPDKFTDAESFCAVNIVATKDSDANPFKGRLTPVGDANLSGTAWHLFADPNEAETLIYGHLQGMEGPRIVAEEAFKTDGVDVKVAVDTGVGAIDFRGAFKNAGA